MIDQTFGYERIVPFLEGLRGLQEHSDWHGDDPFEQTLRLHQWVWQLPSALPQPLNAAPQLAAALALPVQPGGRATQALLALVALLHDLGKAETYTRLPDGTTRCEGHEAASTRLAGTVLAGLDLAPAERSFTLELVREHGEPYSLYKQTAGLRIEERLAAQSAYASRLGAHLPALLLLAYGDMTTSHLAQNKPEKFAGVERFYRLWLLDVFRGA